MPDSNYESGSEDDRHLAVTLLSRADMPERVFPDWAMMHDPARSWLWSPDEIHHGAAREATRETLQRVFARAAGEACLE